MPPRVPAHLLSIGQFAAISGLTVTALRHYDDIGLLTPAHVDPATGYRWYASLQVRVAGVIRQLRAVGMPVADVVETVAAIGDADLMTALLAAHGKRLDGEQTALTARRDLLIQLTEELPLMPATPPSTALLGPLTAVQLFVSDLDRARRFYGEQLGLTVLSTAPRWLILDAGAVHVIVEAVDPDDEDDPGAVGRFLGVSFAVTGMAEVWDELARRGVTPHAPPTRQSWGGILAHIADPDGNVVTLVEYPRG
jgi:DNA-binding transcriptional MerR regulator/predicted enzyme related to lactoylglutathione lyase